MAGERGKTIALDGNNLAYWVPLDEKGTLFPNAHEGIYRLSEWIKEGNFESIQLFVHGWRNTPTYACNMYQSWFNERIAAAPQQQAKRVLRLCVSWPSTVTGQTWEEYVRGSTSSPPDDSDEFFKVIAAGSTDPEKCEAAVACSDYETIARLSLRFDESFNEVVGELKEPIDLSASFRWVKKEGDKKYGLQGVSDDSDDANKFRDYMSFQKMKQRAARIASSKGFQAFFSELVDSKIPVDVMGHSFGCKFALAAVNEAPKSTRIRSLVLMQPAVSRWCLSPDLRSMWDLRIFSHGVGMYHTVPTKLQKPLIVFFSTNDVALVQLYPIATFVTGDRYGAVLVSRDDGPRSRTDYAALGAYGPDIDDPKMPGVADTELIDAEKSLADADKLNILGIRGDWDHGWEPDKKGWCRLDVAKVVSLVQSE